MARRLFVRRDEALVKNVVWTRDMIVNLLLNNNVALIKSMFRIYARQTIDERISGETKYYNNKGFNGFHANIMTLLVNQYINHGCLSRKQLNVARKIMIKYARQLIEIMREENAQPSITENKLKNRHE